MKSMNNIIIIPGANDLLSPQEIRDHKSAFTGSKCVDDQLFEFFDWKEGLTLDGSF
jgi:hypothetical protein